MIQKPIVKSLSHDKRPQKAIRPFAAKINNIWYNDIGSNEGNQTKKLGTYKYSCTSSP